MQTVECAVGHWYIQTSRSLFPLNLEAKFWPMCLSEARAGTELYSCQF